MNMNLLFIGMGPHTQRIQFPYAIRKRQELNIKSVTTLDVPRQKDVIKGYLLNNTPNGVAVNQYYTNKYIDTSLLDTIITNHSITHVVLGTDPEHHLEYAKYAIGKSLKVIMDKPIVAIPNAIKNEQAANLILGQYNELDEIYRKHKAANVVVLSQRRYHPAYNKVADDVIENYSRTKIIPHYLYLMHSDGQLRILNEIDDITYHGFNHGYGKISHSGYHFIDTLYLYLKYFINNGQINNFSLIAHHLSPADYSKQLNHKNIEGIFGFNDTIRPYIAKSDGEIDAYVTIQFKKDSQLVSTVRLDMLHSGFSDRINFSSNRDNLYKGNGRIRHEKQIIMQGPVYAAYIDSLQSKQIDLSGSNDLTELGGEHHFQLIRFNHTSSRKQIITEEGIDELMNVTDLGYSRGHQEEARYYSLDDFFSTSAKGTRSQISDLSDHYFSSLIMSSIYLSICTGSKIERSI